MNGVGKLMMTKTAVGPSLLISGLVSASGYDAEVELAVVCCGSGHSFEGVLSHGETIAGVPSLPTVDACGSIGECCC